MIIKHNFAQHPIDVFSQFSEIDETSLYNVWIILNNHLLRLESINAYKEFASSILAFYRFSIDCCIRNNFSKFGFDELIFSIYDVYYSVGIKLEIDTTMQFDKDADFELIKINIIPLLQDIVSEIRYLSASLPLLTVSSAENDPDSESESKPKLLVLRNAAFLEPLVDSLDFSKMFNRICHSE